MKVLVTGAAGYIGYMVYDRLNQTDNEVIGIDIDSYGGQFEFDLTTDSLNEFKNVDVVIHLAYIPGSAQVKSNIDEAYGVNILGTDKVIQYCAENDCKLIFCSTIGVVGEPISLPIDEGHPMNPLNPYTRQKTQNELHIINHFRLDNYCILRLCNIYGRYHARNEEMVKHTVVNKFIDLALNGKPISINGGSQERDFVHVEDTVEMIAQFAIQDVEPGVYNICSGENLSIWQLAEMIRDYVPDVEIKYDFYQDQDVLINRFKVSRVKTARAIGYKIKHSVAEEIARYLS